MRLHLCSFAAAPVAVLFFAFPASVRADADGDACAAALPPAALYAAVVAAPADARHGRPVAVDVDLEGSAEFSLEGGQLRYGMLFNDVAEGWSWRPQSDPGREDYYRWKFLPLQHRVEPGATYVQEEMVGEPQETRVERVYDYFLAFDNPYRFYPRGGEGFSVPLEGGHGPVRLVALARLGDPAVSESTTFWKAVHGRPVDLTLKKRYLVGKLEALLVCDARDGKLLARIAPEAAR